MDLDGEQDNVLGLEEGIVEGSDDGFLDLSEGEVEVSNGQVQEELKEGKDDVGNNVDLVGKHKAPGEVDKKKGVRKGLFKPSAGAGASSKARMVQAIISTRKRATTNTKSAGRPGEGAKQHEEKGSSNPNPTASKP